MSPSTPNPPLTINAPDPLFVAAVVLETIIVFVVVLPISVTFCKFCNVGPGSYVGSDWSTH
jgi:hypothetical protein